VGYTYDLVRDWLEVEGHSYRLSLEWTQRGVESWLVRNLAGASFKPKRAAHARLIEQRTRLTHALGAKALWQGYEQPGAVRTAGEVRTSARMGNFFSWIAAQRKPDVIVEFGTAFGTSGMYWLSGLESARTGKLFTFEPNTEWAAIARGNLSAVSSRYVLTEGIFEERVGAVLGDAPVIDIAFIDAIHTTEFVMRQFEVVSQRLEPGGLMLFDDVDFSDDMADCWKRLAQDGRAVASVTVAGHVGILEMQ
jgi:predicted O-methyltransferase YrrM